MNRPASFELKAKIAPAKGLYFGSPFSSVGVPFSSHPAPKLLYNFRKYECRVSFVQRSGQRGRTAGKNNVVTAGKSAGEFLGILTKEPSGPGGSFVAKPLGDLQLSAAVKFLKVAQEGALAVGGSTCNFSWPHLRFLGHAVGCEIASAERGRGISDQGRSKKFAARVHVSDPVKRRAPCRGV